MTDLGFGIVGTGFIAGVVATSIERSGRARLAAVSSRRRETAEAFVAERPGTAAVEGVDALLARDDVDAVYVATPTAAKRPIAEAVLAAGKHLLLDKPLPDAETARHLAETAAANDLVLMDATHFVHHPRTAALRAAIPETIGTPRSLHTAFYFPFAERDNIRFDPAQEPTGAVGDMAWYAMRAVVEYLQPEGDPVAVSALAERDAETGGVVRVTGLLGFAGGKTTTFDVGYTAGVAIMDLALLGTQGEIAMDDFLLNWTNSFTFQETDIPTGYVFRTGMATPRDYRFVDTPSDVSQDVLMIDAFAELVASGEADARAAFAAASLQTQSYLDAIWREIA